ncbi:MAG: hypothetical protein RI973_468 [Bacteroidota bacterium]|jgi:NAD(P)H-nitrite reductase large subunit
MQHIVIIGNGITGITAARTIRKLSDHRITVISGESDYFFSRTALMYVYMGQMRMEDTKPYEDWFWEKNRIELVKGWVEKVDTSRKVVKFIDEREMAYDQLLIASGSKSNKLGWPGQHLEGVQGLYTLQDLEAMEHYTRGIRHAVITGGGLIGIEMAEMLRSRNIPVTFLVRENSFMEWMLPPQESQMLNKHIEAHGIRLKLGTELREIWGDKQSGRVKMIVTSQGEKIECSFVGLTTGVVPNIDFLHFGEIELSRGILVNEYLETNIRGVYAAGDCAQLRSPRPGRRDIEALWYTGRKMGEVAALNMLAAANGQKAGKTPYEPGLWFNSAKFFDIEYQVYGDIQPALPEHQDSLYWEHPKGRASIRINWLRESGAVVGFNLMGVRYRQEVCEKWIQQGTHIETVLTSLGLANFDPEFSRQFEPEVVKLYNQQQGKELKLQKRRGLNRVLRFLSGKPA